MLRKFDEVFDAVRGLPSRKVAIAVAQDEAVLEAVQGAREKGLADFVLVGDHARIQETAAKLGVSLDGLEVIHEPNDRRAAYTAVNLVSSGKADVLMKGLINTADLLRAVLDKEVGLRTGRVLSHVAVYELPTFDRFIMVTDGGMNILPTLQQKADIIRNSIQVAEALGISPAKVAVLAAVEVVNPDMPGTLDAAALAKMADRGQIQGAIVDGPLALDNAISAEAAMHKKIVSPVAGYADILMVPNIEVGNVLGKSMIFFAGGLIAGLVVGASKPIILTSRADSCAAKIRSIALGTLLGR